MRRRRSAAVIEHVRRASVASYAVRVGRVRSSVESGAIWQLSDGASFRDELVHVTSPSRRGSSRGDAARRGAGTREHGQRLRAGDCGVPAHRMHAISRTRTAAHEVSETA